MNDIMFCFINGLLSIYIICFFFRIFAQKRNIKLRNFILCIISIIFIVSLIFLKNGLFSFTVLIFVVFALSLLYRLKWYNHIFLTSAITLIFSFAELIVALISSNILNVDLSVLKTGYYFISGMLLSKLLSFVIVAIIKVGKHTLPVKKLGLLWGYISILPLTSFILIFIMVDYIYQIEDDPTMQLITASSFGLLIASNIFIFYVIDKISDRFATEQKLVLANELIERQKKSYRDLYENQSEIKKIKHDLKNEMIGILHDIENQKISDAVKHIKHNCEILESKSCIFISGNSIIDTLISIKSEIADSLGIKLNVEIELSNKIIIDEIDFSILLGNAIDNAIEATQKTQSQIKTVDVNIISKSTNIVIIVKNPTDSKIDVNNLSTTKIDTNMHGFGILQMRNLASKYDGEVFLECNESVFKTTIIINNRGNE